jgi:YggT family protein
MFGASIVYFVTLFVFIFNALLVARVIMSYFVDTKNRLFAFLVNMTEPIMGPVRQVIPQPQGVDFAPLATFLLLEAIQWLVVHLIPVS